MPVGRLWPCLLAVLFVLMAGVPGCEQPQLPAAATTPVASDIFTIVKIFPLDMWRSYEPANINPGGFKFTLYLISAKTQKGAFGDGTIKVDLYVPELDEQGRKQYHLAKSWSFAPDEAMPFRIKQRAQMGWAYQLYLNWGDADVLGKEVRISVSYVGGDGRVIRSRPVERRVPIYDPDAYRAAHAEG